MRLNWLCCESHGQICVHRNGAAWMRLEMLPRVVSGLYASITLAALSCVVALVMAYFGVYGFTWAGVEGYTRTFGQVFNPSVTLVFVLKNVVVQLGCRHHSRLDRYVCGAAALCGEAW